MKEKLITTHSELKTALSEISEKSGDKRITIAAPIVFTKVDSEGEQEFESFHDEIYISLKDSSLEISAKASSGIEYEEEIGPDFELDIELEGDFTLVRALDPEKNLWKIKF